MRPRPTAAAVGSDGWIGPPSAPFPRACAGVLALPRLVWRERDVLAAAVTRELAGRFRGSVLGVGWVLLQPLALFVLYALLFTRLLGVRVDGASGPELAAWMLVGAVAWTACAESVTRASGVLVEQRGLIQRLSFALELLPLQAALAQAALTAAVLLAALPVLAVWRGLGVEVLLAPLVLVLQTLLVAGPCFVVATSHVFWRDTQGLLAVVTPVWMLSTPVYWSREVLGAAAPAWCIEANPAHHLLVCWRAVLLPGLSAGGELSHSLAVLACAALASCALGAAVFAAARTRFADEV